MTRLVRAVLAALALVAATGAVLAADSGGGPAKKQDPNYVQARQLVKGGDFAAAIPLLEKALAADPKNADAYNFLGYSQRKLGDREAALTNYEKALELDPKHRGANEYLGELYLEMGEPEKASERLEVLDSACFFGCDEYRELKAAIEAYRKKAGG